MNRGRSDLAVGVTIIVAIVVMLAAILWVKQADVGRRRDRVTARFRDVGGVKIGTPVVIRGMRAGRVEGMELNADGWVAVRMTIDPQTPLPSSPVVLLNESSLFGEWQATITDRTAVPRDAMVERQLAEAAGTEALPGATLPDIAQLTGVAGRIAGDVASVAERVKLAFDEDAARELRGSIRNFAQLSTVLAQTVREQSGNMKALSSDARGGVASLVRSAELLQAAAERMDSSTANGEIQRIVGDAGEAARQLRESGRRLLAISEQLSRTSGHLEAFLTAGDSVLTKINTGRGSLGMLVNDPSMYRNADSLMRQLRNLVTDLQKNPGRYVHVRLF